MTITLPYKSYFERWLDLHYIFKDNINKCSELTIDFQNVSFLEPKYIVLLSCFLEPYYRQRIPIKFINTRANVDNFLKNIDFYNYFDTQKLRGSFNNIINSNTIALWNITSSERFTYSSFAKTYFEQNFIRNKDLIFIQTNLEEIFNNIFDHAFSEINGFVITQYFPNLNEIKFSVCDTGVGIPTSIAKIKTGIPDFIAIKYSTELFVTTQTTPNNRGRGLNNIIELCRDELGYVTIYSNKGIHYCNNPNASHDNNVSFNGTLIDIKINLNNLDIKDHEHDKFDLYEF